MYKKDDENFHKVSKGGYLDCGYSRLSLAVIQRSETELHKLIERGHDVEGESRNDYSPLSLAIGWTAGIQITAQGRGRSFSGYSKCNWTWDKASVKTLLPECPMFQSHFQGQRQCERSILSYALGVIVHQQSFVS